MILLIQTARAEEPLRDPALPSVTPEALEQLSDSRTRQQIIQHSLAKYPGRCVCPYQTRDSSGRSCKGRHEVIRTQPQPICYPAQVSHTMIDQWRRQPAR